MQGADCSSLRVYRGVISDSERWHRFKFRENDVIITTPSKCGTTWMQSIVATLIFRGSDLKVPVGSVSLWLDALLRSEEEAFAILEAQTHCRFLKTHCPLDGIPSVPGVTYITVVRHPLDVALSSDYDHSQNQCRHRTFELLENSGHGMCNVGIDDIRVLHQRIERNIYNGGSIMILNAMELGLMDWLTFVCRFKSIGKLEMTQMFTCFTIQTCGTI